MDDHHDNEILVVLVESGQHPQSTHIRNDVSHFEEIVDGPVSVETFFISGYRLVCSVDEGFGYLDHSLPKGTYFIARYRTSFEIMTIEEAEEIKHQLQKKIKKIRKKRLFLSPF